MIIFRNYEPNVWLFVFTLIWGCRQVVSLRSSPFGEPNKATMITSTPLFESHPTVLRETA